MKRAILTTLGSRSKGMPARDEGAAPPGLADIRDEAYSGRERIDPLTLAAVAYLLLPLCIFAATWFAPLVSAVALMLIIAAIAPLRHTGSRGTGLTFGAAAWCATLAATAVAFSGTSPLVASIPELDLARYRWLYNDVLRSSWPVVLENDEAGFTILRYTLAYWIVPGAVARLLGGQFAQVIMLAWAALGVAIFLMMVARQARSRLGTILLPIAALAFSGLDVLGVWLFSETNRLHLFELHENWTYLPHGWLIGSNLFGLSWVPHHDIPAWVAGALLFQHHRRRWFQRSCVAIFAAVAFWSAFVGAAFAVATALCFIADRDRSRAIRTALRPTTFVPALVLALGLAFYLAQDTASMPLGSTLGREAALPHILRFLSFVAIEFGVLVLLVVSALRRLPAKLAVAISILLLLPFAYGGHSNDLAMRGSALPMVLVLFTTVHALGTGAPLMRAAIAIVLLIGTFTPFGEMGRLLRAPPTPGDWSLSIKAMKTPFLGQWTARIARDGPLAKALGLPPDVRRD